MKPFHLFVPFAFLLVSCAQQQTQTQPFNPISYPAPSLSPTQQPLAAQFKTTPCAQTPAIASESTLSDIAIRMSSGIQEFGLINPDTVPDYSQQVLERYLNDLDIYHLHLIATDVDMFRSYQTMLWPTLKSGEIKPGFCIYEQYKARMKESYEYALALLNNQLKPADLQRNDSFILRDEKSAIFASIDEKNAYWRTRVIRDLLVKMANDVSWQDAKTQLVSRYSGYLRRLDKLTNDTVFAFYANAFMAALDVHSKYYEPLDEKFYLNRSLNLEGIGLVLEQNDEGAAVVSIVPEGPSEGKLQPGDMILSIAPNGSDYQSIGGMALNEIIDLIRGPKGSVVGLEIRPDKQHNIVKLSITRDAVKLTNRGVNSEIINVQRNHKTYAVGVIHIPSFYADTRAIEAGDLFARSTSNDILRQVRDLESKKVAGIVLDLSHNTGGSLQEANRVAGLFVPKQPTFQIATKRSTEVLTNNNASRVFNGPVIALVSNESSGSAEIVAAVLQDYDAGIVVGQRTFGMGSAATLRDLSTTYKASIKVTMAEYFRVTAVPFTGQGVTPDVELPAIRLPIVETNARAKPVANVRHLPNLAKQGNLTQTRTLLQQRSTARQQQEPGFTYLRNVHQAVVEMDQQTTLALNPAAVKAEIDRNLKGAQSRYAAYQKASKTPVQYSFKEGTKIMDSIWLNEAAELVVDWVTP